MQDNNPNLKAEVENDRALRAKRDYDALDNNSSLEAGVENDRALRTKRDYNVRQ